MSKKRKLRWLSLALNFLRNVTGRQKDELDTAAEVSALSLAIILFVFEINSIALAIPAPVR